MTDAAKFMHEASVREATGKGGENVAEQSQKQGPPADHPVDPPLPQKFGKRTVSVNVDDLLAAIAKCFALVKSNAYNRNAVLLASDDVGQGRVLEQPGAVGQNAKVETILNLAQQRLAAQWQNATNWEQPHTSRD